MNEKEYFILYSYVNPSTVDESSKEYQSNNYFIQECFSIKERIDKEQLLNLYHDMLFDSPAFESDEFIGPFCDKDQLHRYCQELVQKLKGYKIVLISPTDFNSAIQKSDTLKGLEDLLTNSTEVIVNQKLKNKSSFLQRFF